MLSYYAPISREEARSLQSAQGGRVTLLCWCPCVSPQFLQSMLAHYERRPWMWLRNLGLKFAIDYIHAEDLQTNYVDIGPVNKVQHIVEDLPDVWSWLVMMN